MQIKLGKLNARLNPWNIFKFKLWQK